MSLPFKVYRGLTTAAEIAKYGPRFLRAMCRRRWSLGRQSEGIAGELLVIPQSLPSPHAKRENGGARARRAMRPKLCGSNVNEFGLAPGWRVPHYGRAGRAPHLLYMRGSTHQNCRGRGYSGPAQQFARIGIARGKRLRAIGKHSESRFATVSASLRTTEREPPVMPRRGGA